MKLCLFEKYVKTVSYINKFFKPGDRIKAKIVFDGLIMGWLMIFVLVVFSAKGSFIFYKSLWMLLVLSLAFCFIQLRDKWILSIHVVTIGVLCVICMDLIFPGFTPDMLLIQHAFIVIFFSQMVIMNVWGNVYSVLTILSLGWILLHRTQFFSFNLYTDWTDLYLLSISFGIILYIMFKNVKVLRSLISNFESLRITETNLYKDIKNAAEGVKLENEKKTLFFSTISHELRTPLNAIVGFSNLLKADFPEQDMPENLKLLHFSTEYLASTVNNVMESSSHANYINATSSESSFELVEIVQNIYKGLKIKANKKNIAFDFSFDSILKGMSVIGLVDRLIQVIYNLLDNAIKFTNKGGVSLKLLFIRKINSSIEVEFRVQDTGIGIPKHKVKDIFKPYQQASENINRIYGGTGLGLTIVDKLLKLMKSKIQCESELGKGTTFYFRMQFLIPNYRSTHDVTFQFADKMQSFAGMKILVVEDNELNIRLINKVLEKWGVVYDKAFNGLEAYEKVKNNEYDVVLMDVNMPVMSGLKATKKIQEIKPHQKIIFLTANIQQEIVEEMRSLNVFGYLFKPFKVEDLNSLLYKLLKS